MQVTTTTIIDRPVADVFDYMTNMDHVSDWVTEVVEVRYDGDIEEGATGVDVRRLGRKIVEMPWLVTRHEPPSVVVFEYSEPFRVVAEFGFESLGAGTTRLTCTSRLYPTGRWRLLAPFMRLEARKADRIQFAKAKEILETRAA